MSPDEKQGGLELIRRIPLPTAVSAVADTKTVGEEQDLDKAAKAAQVFGFQQDIAERKKYAHRAYCLVVGWLGIIGLILFLQGFQNLTHFNLSGGVLEILIGSTTSGIVGIFLVVTRYLFSSH